MTGAGDPLARLASAYGVATRYLNWRDDPVDVPPDTVRAVLAAMSVQAFTAAQVRQALEDAAAAPWRRMVEPTVLARQGTVTDVTLTLPANRVADVVVSAEDGTQTALPTVERDGEERVVGGARLTRRVARVPATLPNGSHRLTVRAGDREQQAFLLVVPARCPVPEGLRAWGWQVQLYALRSAASWGMGDLGDLCHLAESSARDQGAGIVVLNPLHAAMPVLPQEPSPYYPASRRFMNPLYLRVEECDGYRALAADQRAEVDALAAQARASNTADRIDRDAVFRRKMAAFERLAAQPLPESRRAAYDAYRQAEGQGLVDFATACALAERHGRSFRGWPAALADPRSEAVVQARHALADRVELHQWLQWQCDDQLAAASAAARRAGMPVGLVTDLAVGVDPGGADAWALAADLAQDVTVGAPPDAFNQRGQDWRLPPLRPDRLAATGYAPFRDLVRSCLRHAGGLRIDHVMGLFRLFWIPEGASAAEGTYVRYPSEGLLGVLTLEARSSGALVVGEDLGTVERGVRQALRDRGILSSRVLWFEREEPAEDDPSGEDLPRRGSTDYPELALTSVTTHDLPTAAGFLADEPARVRAALGQLGHDLARERARTAREREELVALLVDEGLLQPGSSEDPEAVLLAMHAFIGRTPSLLVTASLADGVGDLRQPNLPGTTDEYPNWCLPVAQPTGPVPPPDPDQDLLPPEQPLLLEDLLAHPGVARLARVLRSSRSGSRAVVHAEEFRTN